MVTSEKCDFFGSKRFAAKGGNFGESPRRSFERAQLLQSVITPNSRPRRNEIPSRDESEREAGRVDTSQSHSQRSNNLRFCGLRRGNRWSPPLSPSISFALSASHPSPGSSVRMRRRSLQLSLGENVESDAFRKRGLETMGAVRVPTILPCGGARCRLSL